MDEVVIKMRGRSDTQSTEEVGDDDEMPVAAAAAAAAAVADIDVDMVWQLNRSIFTFHL